MYSDLILPFSLYGAFIDQWCGTSVVGYQNTGVQWPDLTILTVWCFYWAVVIHQLWAIKILVYSDLILPFSLYGAFIEQWCGTPVVGYLNTGVQWPDLTILTVRCFYWAKMWYTSCGLSKYWCTVTWSYHSHCMVLLLISDVVHQLWAIKILVYSDLILPFSLYGAFIEQWWYTSCGLSKYWCTVTWSYHSHCMVLWLSSDVEHQSWATNILGYSDFHCMVVWLSSDVEHQSWAIKILGYSDFHCMVLWLSSDVVHQSWATQWLSLYGALIEQWCGTPVMSYQNTGVQWLSLYGDLIEQWCGTPVMSYQNTGVQYGKLTLLSVWYSEIAEMYNISCEPSLYLDTVRRNRV